jgi:hypothetical protein
LRGNKLAVNTSSATARLNVWRPRAPRLVVIHIVDHLLLLLLKLLIVLHLLIVEHLLVVAFAAVGAFRRHAAILAARPQRILEIQVSARAALSMPARISIVPSIVAVIVRASHRCLRFAQPSAGDHGSDDANRGFNRRNYKLDINGVFRLAAQAPGVYRRRRMRNGRGNSRWPICCCFHR